MEQPDATWLVFSSPELTLDEAMTRLTLSSTDFSLDTLSWNIKVVASTEVLGVATNPEEIHFEIRFIDECRITTFLPLSDPIPDLATSVKLGTLVTSSPPTFSLATTKNCGAFGYELVYDDVVIDEFMTFDALLGDISVQTDLDIHVGTY